MQTKSVALLKLTLEAIFDAGAGHTGGGLSFVDILNVLPETCGSPARDRYAKSTAP